MKLVRLLTVLFCFINTAKAQQDSLFISQIGNSNVVAIRLEVATTLLGICTDYNVSEEMLRLFNEYILPTDNIVKEGADVIIPLIETNYYRNISVKLQNGMYVPLYHTINANESIKDVCKNYFLPETSLRKWNNLMVDNIDEGTVLLVGWLRYGNVKTTFTKAEDKMVGNFNVSSFKQDMREDFKDKQQELNTVVGIIKDQAVEKKILPKPNKNKEAKDSINRAASNEQKGNNTIKVIGDNISKSANKVNGKLIVLQNNITDASLKLTKNIKTSYQKERESLQKNITPQSKNVTPNEIVNSNSITTNTPQNFSQQDVQQIIMQLKPQQIVCMN
jgi:hypothetical protein